MKFDRSTIPASFIRDMASTRGVMSQVMKSAIRKRVTAQFDYHFRDGYSAPFIQVNLKISNACNLRCKMCSQWNEVGWHRGLPMSFVRDSVPVDTYKSMVDDVAHLKPWMFIYGGEPFVYRDLLPLIQHMKQKDLIVSVVTNATMLADDAPDLVAMGLDFLIISIDGSRDVHDQIRGKVGTFDRVMAGIEAVRKQKEYFHALAPFVVISATISQDNAGNFDDVFKVCEEIDADAMIMYYSYFQTEESCREHEEFMREKLDTNPISQRGFLWGHDKIDTAAVVETVKRIKARRWPFAYVFAPELTYDEIPRYYTEQQNAFGYGRCIVPWSMTEILPNGDVVTCRDYPDYKVGNIKEDSILKIWNGERYRRFRTVLKQDGPLPVCSRCCGLMDW